MDKPELRFWGVVGSAPVTCDGGRRHGRHTMCASLEAENGEILIFDAGTGIIHLGDVLAGRNRRGDLRLHLIFTHFHLDHVLGLPFFKPLHAPEVRITFHSPWSVEVLRSALHDTMSGRRYPIDFEDTACSKEYRRLPDGPLDIAGARITWQPLHHPQESAAYRLEYRGSVTVLATDTEHPEDGIDRNLLDFCRNADVLVYDATFTPEEYPGKMGWGHSTWLEGTRLAEQAGVRTLILSHLNPDHPDSLLDDMLMRARKRFPNTHIAREE